MNVAVLLPSGFHSQGKRKHGRTSLLFPPLFLGKDQWPMEHFIPRKSQVGIIRKSHEKSGWRCTILLTNILHSMSILFHCSLFNFASYSKEGKLLSIRANWYCISHCLFSPFQPGGTKGLSSVSKLLFTNKGNVLLPPISTGKYIYGHREPWKDMAFYMSSVLNILISSQNECFQGNKQKRGYEKCNCKREKTTPQNPHFIFFFQIYIYLCCY